MSTPEKSLEHAQIKNGADHSQGKPITSPEDNAKHEKSKS